MAAALTATATAAAPVRTAEMNQKAFKDEASKTVAAVAKDVVATLQSTFKICMSQGPAATITAVNLKHEPIAKLDERTSKIFKAMMVPINLGVQVLPVAPMFLMLEKLTKDNQLKTKLIEGAALPYVQAAINTLDAISPTIIEQATS